MDESVKQAMKRWPNVPAVYNWLSLNRKGEWRFHPQGEYSSKPEGESITNEQIQQFIQRNYQADHEGAWFFQNGPQRVFINLPYAPYIFITSKDGLMTHTNQTIESISQWYLDEEGHLFALSSAGPGMVHGRDTHALLFSSQLATINLDGTFIIPFDEHSLNDIMNGQQYTLKLKDKHLNAPIKYIKNKDIPQAMGFIRFPKTSD